MIEVTENGEGRLPTVSLTNSISVLALQIGQIVAGENLYLFGDVVVTLNEKTGALHEMLARQFIGWVETFCSFDCGGYRRIRPSLALEESKQILAQCSFRKRLRVYTPPSENFLLLPHLRERDRKLQAFLVRLASEIDSDTTYTRGDLTQFAREWKMLSEIVGSIGDPAPDSSRQKRFGRQFQYIRGRQLIDIRGRKFEFSHHRKMTGARYSITFLGQHS